MGDWTVWQILAGLGGVLGVGTLVAAYFSGVLNALLPSPARLAGLMRQRDLPLPAGERFVVLIADLQGDDEKRTHTRHVAAALEPYRGLDVIPVGPGPEWGVESRDAFEAKARALLARRHGDVLISGDVTTAGKGVRLRILPGDRRVEVQHGTPEGRRAGEYALTDTGLPLDFERDFDAVLVAFVAASVAPATERQGHYLVDLLEPAAGRLNQLCAKIPARLGQDQRGSLWHTLGLAAYLLGEQKGDNDWLEQAVTAYREALKEYTRERVPLDWAMTQISLGVALWRLGERESGTARLQEAVAAYRESLKEYTRERVPLGWAMTQNNLGNALSTLGERESGTARLEEAVVAYRETLKEYTRERVPLDWAMAQNNLGNALSALGERESGAPDAGRGRLEDAVAAYREALKEYTRERVPLDWAMTQNNLGTALRVLGERESGAPDAGRGRLEEAVAAYREALKERTRERVPLGWAMTQNNLGTALSTLGQRESGTARLQEAVAAYRDALKERTRERVPLDWAMTQNNLGTALSRLGQRESGTARLEQAVEAYRVALEVLRPAGASYYAGIGERNLVRAEALLAERRGVSAAE